MEEQQIIVEQRSSEWFNMRKGKLTASEIHKIIGSKPDLTETAKTYLLEKVSELLGGVKAPAVGAALDWGTETEEVAIAFYEKKTGAIVNKASFVPFGEHAGGSPDGLTSANIDGVDVQGIIEVKCPFNSANHFKHALINSPESFKKIKPEYYWQCVMNMLVTGAEYCDFISFDPRVNPEYVMFTYRMFRVEEVLDDMEVLQARIAISVEYINEMLDRLKSSVG